jgi:hypothetical protein
MIVATRAAIGAGLGLLLADRLSARQRRTLGLTLLAVGGASTVPAVMWVRRGMRGGRGATVRTDRALVGATRYPRKGDDEYES